MITGKRSRQQMDGDDKSGVDMQEQRYPEINICLRLNRDSNLYELDEERMQQTNIAIRNFSLVNPAKRAKKSYNAL